MIKKINIVLANLKNANAAFALLIFIIISQIFAVLLWYWNVGYIGAQWFVISACGNIAGFLMGYRDNDGNKLWDEEFHLPKKRYGEL